MKFILGIVQARVASVRLPRKVLLPLNGMPAVYHVMTRVMKCRDINKIYLASSRNTEDDALAELAERYHWNLYRGSSEDVLSRFVDLVKKEKPDIVARINADNFAIDPAIVSRAIREVRENGLDVCSPFLKNTYPFGAGAEASTGDCLLRIDMETRGKDPGYREHIYSYAYERSKEYRVGLLEAPAHLRRPDINLSVDTRGDYESMRRLYGQFRGRESTFTLSDVIEHKSDKEGIQHEDSKSR